MTVQHHLDDATLVRYASGDLDEAFAVIVASHLDLCETCRHATRDAESIGGQLLETVDQVPLSAGAFDEVLELIDNNKATQHLAAKPAISESDVPGPIQRFIGANLDQITWKTAAPGIRRHMIKLPTQTTSSLYLLRIAAGKAVPEHGHGGSEMTLVLSGAYRDDMGVFGPGDIEDLDEHIEHQPKVLPDAPCICLVATEATNKFKGFFSRMLQPLVGI
jgi:putative transcriptional regulator